MLRTNEINIPLKNIKCTCGHEFSREFKTVENFKMTMLQSKRNIGVMCDECNSFISINSFLSKDEILRVMNNFVNTMCNL